MVVIDYLLGVLIEGLVIGALFWVITYLTVESTDLLAAVRSALIAETVGNLPYLFGVGALTPPGAIMAMVGMFVFVRLIVNVGELTWLTASYTTLMTYFALVAVVSCAPVTVR